MPNRLFAAVLISGVCAASAVYAQSPSTSAQLDARLNAAWNANVAAAESAAISGPDQLKAAKVLQEAVQVWSADRNAQLAAAQKERDEAKKQVAAIQASSKAAEAQANSLRAQLAARPTAADFQKALRERDAAEAKPCPAPFNLQTGHKP